MHIYTKKETFLPLRENLQKIPFLFLKILSFITWACSIISTS